MTGFFQDLRYSVRTLAARPLFAAAAIATIALGIAVNTLVFSVAHPLLIRPLPYASPDRLVWITNTVPEFSAEIATGADYLEWRDGSGTLAAIAAFSDPQNLTVIVNGQAERVGGAPVSPGLLRLLGVAPLSGRDFTDGEHETSVILTYDYWQRTFGVGTPLAGQFLTIAGTRHQVVGVLPPSFRYPQHGEVAVLQPLILQESERVSRQMTIVNVIGRLRSGVAPGTAQAELQAIADAARAARPPESPDSAGPREAAAGAGGVQQPVAVPEARPMPAPDTMVREPPQKPFARPASRVKVNILQRHLTGDVRPALLLLFGAVVLVLAIACANAANLLLARTAARRREISIRAALGADRWQIARQIVVESLALSTAGGVAGTLLAWISLPVLRSQLPHGDGDVFAHATIAIGPAVTLFSAALSILSGLLLGLVPAFTVWRTRGLVPLVETAAGSVPARRIARVLVVAEIALAAMLSAAAVVVVRAYVDLTSVDSGFRSDGVLSFAIDSNRHMPPAEPADASAAADRERRFLDAIAASLRAQPGVAAVGYGDTSPLRPFMMFVRGLSERRGNAPDVTDPEVAVAAVSPDYFTATGIRILRGRAFLPTDDGGPGRGILSLALAQRLFGTEEAIGQRIFLADTPIEIVGIADDVRHDGPAEPPRLQLYQPFLQEPRPFGFVVVRTSGDAAALASVVRDLATRLDPTVAVFDVATVSDRLALATALPRFNALLAGFFAVLALILGAVGLHGMLAWMVAQRFREIGVRIALGASEARVLRMVMGHALGLIGAGLVAGWAGALALTAGARALLPDLRMADAGTLAIVGLVLSSIGVLAAYIPARRAASVDPIEALRIE